MSFSKFSTVPWQSRDSISTVLCHSVRLESPNEQGGATVEIESRDCQDTRGFVYAFLVNMASINTFFIVKKISNCIKN